MVENRATRSQVSMNKTFNEVKKPCIVSNGYTPSMDLTKRRGQSGVTDYDVLSRWDGGGNTDTGIVLGYEGLMQRFPTDMLEGITSITNNLSTWVETSVILGVQMKSQRCSSNISSYDAYRQEASADRAVCDKQLRLSEEQNQRPSEWCAQQIPPSSNNS